MTDFLQQLRECVPEGTVLAGEPMAGHTTFAAGGPARYFVIPEHPEQLEAIAALCRRENESWMVLGRGSNLLVSDRGYPGVMVSTENWKQLEVCGTMLRAQAGVSLAVMAQAACAAGLAGLEFASGIPGSLGGAVVMNAGAYGSEMKDVLFRVQVMDAEGKIKWLDASMLDLGYRHSCIAEKGDTVLCAELKLWPGDVRQIRETMKELNRRRREKQPLEYPSAGSTFKRPEGYFAGKLIQDAGLAGYAVGGAAVSEKHCGFVINRDHASADDIWKLCCLVRRKVEEQFGVRLEPEIKLVGDFEESD